MTSEERTMESPWLNESLGEALRTDIDFVRKCPDIATDMQRSKLKLVTLVERLGDVLTDSDPNIRSRGVEILAEVLHNLPRDFLNDTEQEYIAGFFVARLVDHCLVTPATLKGILAIVQMENAPRDIGVRVLRAVFQEHIQCQTLKPADRRNVYKMFEIFIHNCTADLKSLGSDFVYGFMSAIDQEKDARNLMIVFGMLPYFIKTFPLGHLTEEMFEIISCYFPVDYRPEYSDCPVTRDDLANRLLNCLVASPDFAEFCIPLLIEKLDSKLKLAKLDSFNVLVAGCEVFPVDTIRTYFLDLWRVVHHEVLPGSDRDVRELGLGALKAIVKRISEGATEKHNVRMLTGVTSVILNSGMNLLSDVEMNLFLPTVRMMLTVAEASYASCQEVCRKVLPALITQYYKECGMEQKVTVLRALTSFVGVCETHNVSSLNSSDFSTIWQDLPTLFLGAAQFNNPEVRKEGFHGLAVSGRILDPSSRDILYDLLKRSINEEDDGTVRTEMLMCLKEISRIHSSEVVEKIVEVKLEDISSWPDDGCSHIYLVLESLCKIADAEPFTSLIIPSLLQLIIESVSLEKCHIGMKCLRKLLESCGESKIYTYMYLQCGIVSRLISWWLKGVSDGKNPLFENEELICNTAKIVNIIVKNQEERIQAEIVNLIMPQIINVNHNLPNGYTVMPLNFSSPQNHTVVIVLLEALIGSIHRDIRIPNLHQLVVDLAQLAIHSSHSLTQLSACRLSANLVNKTTDDDNLLKLLEEMCEKVLTEVVNSSKSNIEKQNSANVTVWITKALVMRGHSQMKTWVDNLIELMAKHVVGEIVAKGFSLIMKEDIEYLNTESFCNIRVLFKQRFFVFSSNLIEAFHSAHPDVKSNYLVALGHMLQGVPQEVFLMNLEKMVPLLVESLQQPDGILLSTTLDTLHSVMKSDQALQNHLQTFVPCILALAKFQFSMKVRIKSLQCINQICNYPTTLILPFKRNVLKVIGECLDDHKRLVRKEAVLARSHWFLVGTISKK